MEKQVIIRTLQDWVNSNPIIKKKFDIEDIFILPNKSIEITTSSTTKTNLSTLKKYVKNILKYFSLDVENVIFSDQIPNYDFDKIISEYLKKVGLKTEEYQIHKENLSKKFVKYDVILDINMLRLMNLKNFQLNQTGLFLYEFIDRKYKNLFSLNFKFTDRIEKSITEFNKELLEYLKTATFSWRGSQVNTPEFVKKTYPSVGFFKSGPTTLTVFHNQDNHIFTETLLSRALDNYFKFFDIKKLTDWNSNYPKYHLYRRGPWIKKSEIAYGFVEPENFYISPELRA